MCRSKMSRITVVVIAIVLLFGVAGLASAEMKHCKGTATLVGIPAQTTLNLDDVPDHKVQLTLYTYDHTSTCEEFGEFRQMSYAYDDIVGGSARAMGYFTNVTKEGDTNFGNWSGKSKTEIKEDGSWEMVFSGVWEATGGTGKLEGVKGKGTYGGKATAAGFLYDWEGDFDFPD